MMPAKCDILHKCGFEAILHNDAHAILSTKHERQPLKSQPSGMTMSEQFTPDPTLPVLEREVLEGIVEIFGSEDYT